MTDPRSMKAAEPPLTNRRLDASGRYTTAELTLAISPISGEAEALGPDTLYILPPRPTRPIPKWAASLNHIPVGEDEPGWAFYLQDPVSGIAWGFDVDAGCWCFGAGTGDTLALAAADHLRNNGGSEADRLTALAILYAQGRVCPVSLSIGYPDRANAEIKRLLCMAHETYDPKALDALTRALVAQGFGK